MRKKINPWILKIIISLLFLSHSSFHIYAQYAATKVRSVHEVYTDSLKKVKYNYIFPFLGQQAYKKGFDIPYPVGIMANYMSIKQGILISEVEGSAINKYSMNKQVVQMWNGLIGAQFQLNKKWIIRSEAGVIGDRKSILASVNDRFPL